MRQIPLIILLAALMGALMAQGARRRDSQADVAKADYLFLEAQRAKALDRFDAAYQLLHRAHQLNPADLGIQAELAGFMLAASRGDSATVAQAAQMLRRAYRENPEYYSGVRLALLDEGIGQMDESLAIWRELHTLYPDRPALTMRLADVLAQAGDSAQAAESLGLYRELEVSEGPSVQLTSKQIQAMLRTSPSTLDTAAITAEAKRLLASSPASVEFNVFTGDVMEMFQFNDSASFYYDRAVELDPASGLAVFSRANHYAQMGDTVSYDREVFRALGMDDLDYDTKSAILRDYVSKLYADPSQRSRICAMFDRMALLHPAESELHQMYSQYLVAVQDWDGAAEQVQRALDLEPDNEPMWEMLASLHIQTDDYPAAAQAARQALRYFPQEPQLHYMLGSVYTQTDSLDQAMQSYRRALELAPEEDVELRSSLQASMGDVFHLRQMPDSAYAYYDRAVAINPDNSLALNNYAYYLSCENRDLERAQQMIDRAVAARPDDATTLDTQAWVLFRRKDYDKAREVIDKALAAYDKPTYEIFEHAGDIYFMAGDPDKALEFWKKALELNPDSDLLKRKVKHKTYFYK